MFNVAINDNGTALEITAGPVLLPFSLRLAEASNADQRELGMLKENGQRLP
jgi:hypothetical protein